MSGTILITGGTSGLGLATAERLLAGGSRVAITGRDPQKLQAVARDIGATPVKLDLGSLAGIAENAAAVRASGLPPLAALVANAGLQVTRPTVTEDGFEATFGVNHLGHVALIARLLADGAFLPGARIILVSSGTHDADLRTGMPKPLPIDARALSRPAPATEDTRESRRRYSTSKLANVMTAYALARRLSATGITVNAYDPGLMPGTGLARSAPRVQRVIWRTAMRALVVLEGVSTPRRSGETLAALAVDEALARVSGTYWSVDRERRSSTASYDVAAQDRLWRESLDLIGLADPTEAHLVPAEQ